MSFLTIKSADSNVIIILLGERAHVLRPSMSRYHLTIGGTRRSYCCQDCCCDGGLRPEVANQVRVAKQHGAREVVLRNTKRVTPRVHMIEGLPVVDTATYLGVVLGEGAVIDDRGSRIVY